MSILPELQARIENGFTQGRIRQEYGSAYLTSRIEMLDKFRRLLKLPGEEKRLLLAAWVRLARVDITLRFLPFPRARRLIQRQVSVSTKDAPPDPVATALRIRYLVGVAAHHHWRPMHCLPQSIAARDLLADRGIKTDLRIGVRRTQEGVAAHAWLEYDGDPLGEPEAIENQFTPLVAAREDL